MRMETKGFCCAEVEGLILLGLNVGPVGNVLTRPALRESFSLKNKAASFHP